MTEALTTYIGIDPGANGALVALCPALSLTKPIKQLVKPKSDEEVCLWLSYVCNPPVKASIEIIKPTYGPGTGKGQMAKLYGSYRALRMALTCLKIPFIEVESQTVWRALGISSRKQGESTKDWKNRHKQVAQRIFSGIKVTAANCDALLIAEYLKRKDTKSLIAPMSKPERKYL